MVDLLEINEAIHELENSRSSWDNYFRLSILYAILNQHNNTDKGSADTALLSNASMSATSYNNSNIISIGNFGDSDFLQAISGKSPAAVFQILDSLMSTIQVVNRKSYNSTMEKLGRLEDVTTSE